MKSNTLLTAALLGSLTLLPASPARADENKEPGFQLMAEPKLFLPGDAVPALQGLTMIQGEQPASLAEPGKLYLIECWATWCGPCVGQIPHLDKLHKAYAEKGLSVVGMNVFEDGLKMITEFVQKRDDMSYPVAYSGGRKSPFSSTWMIPNGHRAIPHAFLVKDGKLLFSCHPASITNEMIEGLLAGTFDTTEMVAKQMESAKRARIRHENQKMAKAGNWAGVEKACKEALDNGDISFSSTYLIALIHQSKFDLLETLVSDDNGLILNKYAVANTVAHYADSDVKGLDAFAAKMLAFYQADGLIGSSFLKRPGHHMDYARFLYLTGKVEETDAHLAAFHAKLKATPDGDRRMNAYYSAFIERFRAKIAAGEPVPALREIRR